MKLNKIALASGILFLSHPCLHAAQSVQTSKELNYLSQVLQKKTVSQDVNNKNSGMSFSVLNERQSGSKKYLTIQQQFKGIPVWNRQIVVGADQTGKLKEGYGQLFQNMENDLQDNSRYWSTTPKIAQDTFLSRMNINAQELVKTSSERIIYLDDKNVAHYAFKIEWMQQHDTQTSRRFTKTISILNSNLVVLAEFDGLFHSQLVGGSGPSGNIKVPKPNYDHTLFNGEQYDGTSKIDTFVVTKGSGTGGFEDGRCYMNTDLFKVETRNADNSDNPASEAFSYVCNENNENTTISNQVDSGGNPLNDAHYHAQITQLMYQDYLGEKAMGNQTVVQHVHFSQGMDQAFYEDGNVYYGDGLYLFYPMVSLDVVAHEISHGFTHEYGSGSEKLMLAGQARAINEGFSDIAAEVTGFYLNGDNDWRANFEAYQDPTGALRYLDDPPKDGSSIDHIDDWESNIGAHQGGGVFNKAFYHLVTQTKVENGTNPWTPKYAFVAFANANKNCWTSTSNYQSAAQCVINQANTARSAMIDDGVQNAAGGNWKTAELKNHIRKAFARVGIRLTVGNGLESDFSSSTRFMEVDFQNLSRLNGNNISANASDWDWSWDFGPNVATSSAYNPGKVTFTTPGEHLVSLRAQGPNNQVDTFELMVNTWDDYCPLSGGNIQDYFIDSVDINGVNLRKKPDAPYTQHSNSIDVTQGVDFNVTMTAGDGSSIANNNNKNFYIWLDEDGDGLFHKTDELVYSGISKTGISTSLNIGGRVGSNIRARMAMSFSLLTKACDSFTWGEVEDFTLAIKANNNPVNLNINETIGTNQVSFSNNTSDGRVQRWEWEFGDGGTSSQKSPVHQYSESGDYTVTARAIGENDNTLQEWTRTIAFSTTTQANFSVTTSGKQVTLNNSSIKPLNTAVEWNMGNGQTLEGDQTSYTYQNDGTYTITLKLTNADNAQGVTSTQQVTIGNSSTYQPKYSVNITPQQNGTYRVKFNNNSTRPADANVLGLIKKVSWTFGDGSSSSKDVTSFGGHDVEHTYNRAGTYVTRLDIRYLAGNFKHKTVTTTKEITVGQPDPIDYCEVTDDTSYEYIDSFNLNGTNYANGDAGGLVNDNPIVLQGGQTHNFTITAGIPDGEVPYAENYHIWIDLNGDGQFGDGDWRNNKTERVADLLDITSGDSGNGQISGSFTIPSNLIATNGQQVRMRVLQYYSGFRVDNINPCSNYPAGGGSGEIEDYLVELRK